MSRSCPWLLSRTAWCITESWKSFTLRTSYLFCLLPQFMPSRSVWSDEVDEADFSGDCKFILSADDYYVVWFLCDGVVVAFVADVLVALGGIICELRSVKSSSRSSQILSVSTKPDCLILPLFIYFSRASSESSSPLPSLKLSFHFLIEPPLPLLLGAHPSAFYCRLFEWTGESKAVVFLNDLDCTGPRDGFFFSFCGMERPPSSGCYFGCFFMNE